MPEKGEIDRVTVRVYQLRVAHPTYLASQLAERAGLSAEQVAAAEAKLSELGLLQRSPGGGWVAVSPEAAADALLAPLEQDILQRRIAIAAMRERLHALSGDYLEARSLRSAKGSIEVVTGIENVQAVIDEAVNTARESIDTLNTRGPSGEAVRATVAHGADVARRGVRLRALFLHSARSHRPGVLHAQRLAAVGAEVRSTSVLPHRVFIADGRCSIIPNDPDDPSAGVAVIRDTAVVGFLNQLFEHYWAEGLDFWMSDPDSGPEPTGMERDVLLLLAAGQSNEAIAEHLGISPRSVSRLVASLMDRLGATNRFQAGVKAATNGWLS